MISSPPPPRRRPDAALPRAGSGARNPSRIRPPDFSPEHAHGKSVATLSRAGTGYSVNDRRSYDAWGQVRAQQSGGDPKLRYCASIGHKQDDESGLIYMRARYYEPTSGRFTSQDPGRQGTNWFSYCGGNPVDRTDRSGNEYTDDSFDPVYWFKWDKFTNAYVINIVGTLPQLILAAMKGPIGVALALIGKGASTGYLGASITLMYTMRIVAWMDFLFEDGGDGWRDDVPNGFNHWFEGPTGGGS